MASVKTVAELLLLGCLVLIVTSAPVQEQKKNLTPRTGRSFRTKTAGSSLQHPFLSANRKIPDSVARFGSRPASTSIKTKQSQKTHISNGAIVPDTKNGVDKGSELATEETKQPLPTSDSTFGDRINHQEIKPPPCRIKGGCSTAKFTPNGGISINGVPTNGKDFQGANGGSEQPQEVTGSDVPEENGQPEATYPDYEGLLSPNGFPSVKGGQVTPVQVDEIQPDLGSTQIISDTITDHTDIDQQTQIITQSDFSDIPSTFPDQEEIPVQPNGPISSPPEQPHPKVFSGVKGHRNHIPSRFEPPPSIVPETQGPLITEPISSQPPLTDITLDTQGPPIQQEINGQSTFPDFIPDTQGPPIQQEINGQPTFTDFVAETQGPIDQQQINGQPTSADLPPDSQGILTQQEENGQAIYQDFIHDSQGHVAQEQINGQSSIVFGGNHQEVDNGQYYHSGNLIDRLRVNVPGNPGEDYPIFYAVPQTSFDCKQQQFSAGIYGDMEASCQVFHICKEDGGQDSFLCPNGTVFNQQYFVCDWWYNFKCADTPTFYNLNADLYWDWDKFTPNQVLNGPAVVEDQISPNFPGNDIGRASANQFSGQSDAIKSTIAIDNSAITNKDIQIPEQEPEDHEFPNGQNGQSDDTLSKSSVEAHDQGTTVVNFEDSFGSPNFGQEQIEQTFETQGPDTQTDFGDGSTAFNINGNQGGSDTPVTDVNQHPEESPENGEVNQVQQEYLQTNFDSTPSIFGGRDENIDQQTVSVDGQQDFSTSSQDIPNEVISTDIQEGVNGNGLSQVDQDVQQEHVTDSFDEGNLPTFGSFPGSVQQEYIPQEFNGDIDNGGAVVDVQQNVQQEFVPQQQEFVDNGNGNGPSTVGVPTSLGDIENNQEGNHEIGQDQIPISLDQQTVNPFGNNNVPEPEQGSTFSAVNQENLDNFEPTDQQYIPNQFEDREPDNFNGGVGDSSPYDHTNGNIQQENVVIPFDGNSQTTFVPENNNNFNNVQQEQISYNGDQNNGNLVPGHQQHAILEIEEKGVPIVFSGGRQNTFQTNRNSHFQEQQTFRQGHTSVNYNNNYENREHNSFNQNNNYRPIQDKFQNYHQGNPINAGANQNTHEAFRTRLNNFQPEDIHLMNRGQFHNTNFQQQRVSFRPYSQNVPNAVNFPENSPLTSVANQENDASPNYSNDKGSYNRNFFATNGHQVHDAHPIPQQPNIQNFVNDQPTNNVHGVQHYGSQNFNQAQFNNNPIRYENNQGNVQVNGINQQGPYVGNYVANNGNKEIFYKRNLDTSGQFSADVNPRVHPVISIKAGDVNNFSQPAPESPNSMNNNGWKPVVKQ